MRVATGLKNEKGKKGQGKKEKEIEGEATGGRIGVNDIGALKKRKEKGRRMVDRRENLNMETGNQDWYSSEVEDEI